MIKSVRGTRDLLPPETELWNFVEATVRDVFRAYSFHEIRTPIFEDTQLFMRSVGEETDIVSKEMYTWTDQGRGDREDPSEIQEAPKSQLSISATSDGQTVQLRATTGSEAVRPEKERRKHGRRGAGLY
jgi:histidyl-tRNA synthetase